MDFVIFCFIVICVCLGSLILTAKFVWDVMLAPEDDGGEDEREPPSRESRRQYRTKVPPPTSLEFDPPRRLSDDAGNRNVADGS